MCPNRAQYVCYSPGSFHCAGHSLRTVMLHFNCNAFMPHNLQSSKSIVFLDDVTNISSIFFMLKSAETEIYPAHKC